MRWGPIIGGLVLVIIGVSMFGPEAELPQTPTTTGLFSVIVALGIGAIGGALMPDSLSINGKDVKPLGLGGTATGGAAFFIATLVFLYATGVNTTGAAPAPKPEPTETPGPAPTPTPGQTPAPTPSPQPSESAAPQPLQPVAQPGPIADPYVSPGAAMPGMVRARTYCSQCCNGNPIGCAQVGGAQAYSYQDAAGIAYRMCVANQGVAQFCYSNMQQF